MTWKIETDGSPLLLTFEIDPSFLFKNLASYLDNSTTSQCRNFVPQERLFIYPINQILRFFLFIPGKETSQR